MQYLHENGALLVFYHDAAKWTKEFPSYFFNYNFKVGHEPWICMNPLRLANPHNSNKTVRLAIFSFTFSFIFISDFGILYYIIIRFSFYFTFIAFANSPIHGTLACFFFS